MFFFFCYISKLFQLDITQGVSYSFYGLVVILTVSEMQSAQLNRLLLTEREVKMAGYGPRSFLLAHGLGCRRGSWICKKRSLQIISSHLDRTSPVRKGFILWQTGHQFLAGHSEQSLKGSITPCCHSGSQLQCRMWVMLPTSTTSPLIKLKFPFRYS